MFVPTERSMDASWSLVLDELNGAYSENTIRGYRADFEDFYAWCVTTGNAAAPRL